MEITIRFNLGTRLDGTVCVAIEVIDEDGDSDTIDAIDEIDDEGGFPKFLTRDPDSDHLLISALNVEETKEKLIAFGYEFNEKVFMWYHPSELSFQIDPYTELEEDSDDLGQVMIVAPQDSLHYDTIYEGVMYMVPECFGRQSSENVWDIKEGVTYSECVAELVNMGFSQNTNSGEF
jgi:hypothetical protein